MGARTVMGMEGFVAPEWAVEETGLAPDFAALYRVPVKAECDDECEPGCRECDYPAGEGEEVPTLTPREAGLIWFMAGMLGDQCHDSVRNPGDLFSVLEWLPPPVRPFATPVFQARTTQCFYDVQRRVGEGRGAMYVISQCSGDDWALSQILGACDPGFDAVTGDYGDVLPVTVAMLRSLPSTWLDEQHARWSEHIFSGELGEMLLPDLDLEWLYDLPEDALVGMPTRNVAVELSAIESMGVLNLHPNQWFVPFANAVDDYA